MSPSILDFDYMLQLFKEKPEVLLTLSMCYLSKQPKSLSHVLRCEVCVRLSNPHDEFSAMKIIWLLVFCRSWAVNNLFINNLFIFMQGGMLTCMCRALSQRPKNPHRVAGLPNIC